MKNNCLQGKQTRRRCFRGQDVSNLLSLVDRLHLAANWTNIMERACDTSFLYSHRSIIANYLETIYENKEEAYRLNVSLFKTDDELWWRVG